MSRKKQSGWRLWMLALLMTSPLFGQIQTADPEESPTVTKKLSVAVPTYELIVGYIEKEDYAAARREIRNLLDLKLPAKYDPQMIEAIARIAEKLTAKHQFNMAHATVDAALKDLGNRDDNEAKLLMAKAYIFKAEGKKDKALEYFNKARDLEDRSLGRTKESESKGASKP